MNNQLSRLSTLLALLVFSCCGPKELPPDEAAVCTFSPLNTGRALSQRDAARGYFIEGGGWDSSYNGVAAKLALELFTLLPSDPAPPIRRELEIASSCAMNWQKSRILTSGEISTEGNTRGFSGWRSVSGQRKGSGRH